MTNLLALDTATDACSLALWLDGNIIQRQSIAPRQHVRLALPMLNELLLEAGIPLSQLDALVLGAGPGSFTGLRIAAGLVQGLAFGLNLPVVTISTLRTIAQGLYRETGIEKVSVVLNASMGQVYAGEYSLGSDGLMHVIGEDRLYSQEGSLPPLRGKSLPRTRCGVPEGQMGGAKTYPQARYLIELGYHEFIAGRFVTAEQAQPLYLRYWSGA